MSGILESGRFEELQTLAKKFTDESGNYWHWDDFRHRVSGKPKLTAEEQWAALKFSRFTRFQKLPLRDKNGKAFQFFLTQFAFERLRAIDLHCGGGLSLPEEVTNRDSKDRYYITSLMEESLTSSQLEGAVVTRSEAREMIRNERPPTNSHEKMVMNNFRTMMQMEKWRKEELTPGLILEIHREITAETLEETGQVGSFRRSDEIAIFDEESNELIHRPPGHVEIDQEIERLCEFANETELKGFMHPVLRSIILHFWMAYLHPFHDGNGRTARALFYWSMLKQGYWLFEFISISHEILKAPKKYYRAFLHSESDEGDLNYFIHHQLGVIEKAVQGLLDYIDKQRAELARSYQMLQPGKNYNHRQLAVIKHALKKPLARYSVKGHQTSHGIANQTARTDLQELADEGLLSARKIGRAQYFFPASNLKERLGKPRYGEKPDHPENR